MYRYNLSEEYSQIYSNKFDANSYDNLRFVDYMQDEDIEYVMESLYWEFRDYGNSSDESLDVLKRSLSEDIVNETLDFLAEEVNKGAAQYLAYSSKRKMEPVLASKKAAADTKAASEKAAADAARRAKFEARRARVTGAINRVKTKIGSGLNRFRTNVNQVGSNINSARKSGMAQLSKLVRSARTKVGDTATSVKRVGSAAKAGVRTFKKEMAKGSSREMAKGSSREDRGMGRFKQPQEVPSLRRTMAMSKLQKAAAGTSSAGVRFAAPGGTLSSKRAKTGKREAAAKFAKKLGLSDDFAYLLGIIMEDLMNEGYADTIEDAFAVFENLSDNIIETTINEYADYYLSE